MSNQRSRNKKVISVPFLKDVLEAIEAEAARRGVERTVVINEALAERLNVPLPEESSNPAPRRRSR